MQNISADTKVSPEIKKRALKLMDITEYNLCAHCWGRIFFQEIEAPDNQERGKQIMNALKGSSDRKEIDSNHVNHCSICQDIFQFMENGLIDDIKKYIEDSGVQFSTFLVGCRVPSQIIQKEEEIHQKLKSEVEHGSAHDPQYETEHETEYETQYESIKKEINRELGKALSIELDKEVDFETPNLVIVVDFTSSFKRPKIELQINPLFIEGRYRKLIRGIPQTKWPCRKCRGRGCEYCGNTGKMYQESVEELISPPVVDEVQGTESKFHGAGREDVDVKMLGQGRPFVIEIKEPLIRTPDLKGLEGKINQYAADKVEVSLINLVEKERRGKIKTSSTDSYKIYRAVVDLEDNVSNDDLKLLNTLKDIKQRTPLRVSHRRADLIRNRSVRNINFKKLSTRQVELVIECQGGLYIKELISGDDHRTQPSVSSLLQIPARCVELDVLDVHLD